MLFKEEVLKKIPALYSQDGAGDKAIVKAVVRLQKFVWLITEYDPESEIFFGFTCLNDIQCAELGYISLYELEDLNKKYNLELIEVNMELKDAKDTYIFKENW